MKWRRERMHERRGWKGTPRLALCFLAFVLICGGIAPFSGGSRSVYAQGSVAQDPYEWSGVPIGGGGYVTGMVAHPAEQDLVYIRTDVGGMYRWNEAEKTWRQLVGFADRSEVNLYGVDSMAIDPSNPDILYAALGKYDYWSPSDIYKSVDRGETWTRTNLKAGGADVPMNANGVNKITERITVDPNDGNVIYYGSRTKGLFRSTAAANSGSWEKVASFPALADSTNSGITFIAFDPATGGNGQPSQTIYAGAFNTGVYVSRNAGATWTLLSGSPVKPKKALIDQDGYLYVTHSSGIARLEGNRWVDLTPPGEAGKIFIGITVDHADKNVIMTARGMGEHNNPIYRSTDRGATWTKLTYTRNISTPWMPDWHWSSETSSIVIDPYNSKRVWFTDWYYPWRTDDITVAPSEWTNYAKGLESTVNVSNLTSPPGGRAILHSGIADNGGFDHVSLTDFPASTYFTGSSAIGLMTTTGIDVQVTDPEYVVRVGTYGWNGDNRESPGNGAYSLDGGVNYTGFATLPYKKAQGGRVAVSATSPDNIIWMPQRSDVYVTLDRGVTWQRGVGAPSGGLSGDNVFGNYYQPLSSDKVNGSIFYLYDKSGRMYVTTNGGISWSPGGALPAQSTAWHNVEAAPGIMGEVWVGLNNQGLYRSSDAGKSFAKVEGVETAFLFSFGKHAPGRLNPAVFVYGKVAGHAKEAIFRSDDMGETWVKASVDEPFPGNDPNAMTGDRQVHGRVYVGTNGSGLLYGARTEPLAAPVYTDTETPSVPNGLRVTAAKKASVDVSWNAATDTGGSGIKGYRISDGNGSILAETYGTSYSVGGLAEKTSYSFKVQAMDYAGNLSGFSAIVTATTQEAKDTTPPSIPQGLHALESTAVKVRLAWEPNQEADLLGYNLYRSETPEFEPSETNRIGTMLTASQYTDWSGIKENTTYYYKLQAADINRLMSGASAELAVRTSPDSRVELIVDNLDSGFTSDGGWSVSQYTTSRFGLNYFHDNNVAGKWAKWTPYVTQAGEYNVYMLWNSPGSRGYNIPLEIAYDGGKDNSIRIHQNGVDNMWVYLGTYKFAPGTGQYVKLTTNGTDITIADAVKFSLAATDPYGATHENRSTAGDAAPPIIKLDQMDGTVTGLVYGVSGRTNKGALLKVRVNGTEIPTPYSSNYVNTFRLNLPLQEGANQVQIDAVERGGQTFSAALSLQAVIPTVPATSVSIDTYGMPAVIQAGDQFPLWAAVHPEDASDKTIQFTTSNPAVATVTDAVYQPIDGKTHVLVTAVSPGQAVVTAISADGQWTDEVNIRVEGPVEPGETDITPPGEVTAAAVSPGDGQLTLAWSDPPDEDLASVRIIRENPVPSVTEAVYVPAGQRSIIISGLDNGISYTYRISTRDQAGNLSSGITVTGTPLAPAVYSGGSSGPSPDPGKAADSVGQGKLAVTVTPAAGGISRLVLRETDVKKAVEQAGELSGTVDIEIASTEPLQGLEVELPITFASRGEAGNIKAIRIHAAGLASVTLPAELLAIQGEAGVKVKLQIAKAPRADSDGKAQAMLHGADVYDLALTLNGRQVSDFGTSKVKVELDYSLQPGEKPHKVIVFTWSDKAEKLKVLKNSRYDPATKRILLQPHELGKFAAVHHEVAFTDLTGFGWAQEGIEALAAREAVSGIGAGQFHPEGRVTRAEFVTMLMNAFDLTRTEAKSTLADVEQGSWYYAALASAQELGIVQGREDGSFGIHEEISRQDMAVVLYRVIRQLEGELKQEGQNSAFADEQELAGYAREAVRFLKQTGIADGVGDGRFAPYEASSRAQAAVMIYRLYQQMRP
ncbi:S-layer homology domain-containing protein [Paenibacillus mesotrionivorans]|uniref:S-layer homology domain-containing protein n=1 Tax=Paenibacillus mesotrionivorans TaxID=3160968 RepID=A0ACC7P6B7_9BACL